MLKIPNRMGSGLDFNSSLSRTVHCKTVHVNRRDSSEVWFVGIIECYVTMKMYKLQLDLATCFNFPDIVNGQIKPCDACVSF